MFKNTSYIDFFPQVIGIAEALAARPKSQVLKSNMEMYKSTWETHIHVLSEAVDDITSIDDFLAVSGAYDFLYSLGNTLFPIVYLREAQFLRKLHYIIQLLVSSQV